MHQPLLNLRHRPQAIRLAYVCVCWLLAAAGSAFAGPPAATAAAPAFDADAPHRVLISRHCLGCHNGRLKTAGLELDALVEQHENLDRATWEKVVRKLRARQMPRQAGAVRTRARTGRPCRRSRASSTGSPPRRPTRAARRPSAG